MTLYLIRHGERDTTRDYFNTALNHIPTTEHVAIFSHEGYIRLFLCNILGLDVFRRYRFRIDFGGVTEMEYLKDRGEFRLIRVNHVV